MKVLVTGQLGFVGVHLWRALREEGHELLGRDLKHGYDLADCYLPPADRVYHLAAQTDAQSNFAYLDARTNVMGTLRVLAKYGDKVVFASSSMVNYPQSPYAISKLAGEHYARYFGAAIVRFCNLYGPGGHSVMDKFRDAERLTIFGSGEQRRHYAVVSDAVHLMLHAKPGQLSVLRGTLYTVNEMQKCFQGSQSTVCRRERTT